MSKSSTARGDADWMWQTYAALVRGDIDGDPASSDPLAWLGWQLDQVSRAGRTAQLLLGDAVEAGDWDAFALLRSRGATVDGAILGGAIWRGDVSTLRRLLVAGGDPDAIATDGPLLFDAILRGDPAMIDALLEAGADLEYVFLESTPLMWAAFHGRVPMVDLLLDRGADPAAFHDGDTPAGQARKQGHDGLAERLERLALARAR